ncbi:MAG: hypothetical protein AB7K24_31395 [Gemmataceae bacterium]
MLRKSVSVLMVVCLFLAMIGVVYAAEGTVVKFEKGKLTVKVGGKDEEVPLKGVKIVDAGGNQVKGKKLKEALKVGGKVDIKKEGDKVVEITIK